MNYPRGVSPSFQKRANEAAFWEAWVGAVLARAGLWTLHHPFEADGGDNHGLTWDLDVSTDGGPLGAGPWVPTECKSLSLTFSNPDDYPFESALICSFNSWRKKWGEARETLRDFLLISRPTGHILWIPVGTQATVTKVTDSTRDETYKVMQTTRDCLRPLIDFVENVKKEA